MKVHVIYCNDNYELDNRTEVYEIHINQTDEYIDERLKRIRSINDHKYYLSFWKDTLDNDQVFINHIGEASIL